MGGPNSHRAGTDLQLLGAGARPMTSSWMLAIVGVIYAGSVVTLYLEGHPYKALMFFGYAVAQVGIILDVLVSNK